MFLYVSGFFICYWTCNDLCLCVNHYIDATYMQPYWMYFCMYLYTWCFYKSVCFNVRNFLYNIFVWLIAIAIVTDHCLCWGNHIEEVKWLIQFFLRKINDATNSLAIWRYEAWLHGGKRANIETVYPMGLGLWNLISTF